MSSTSSSGENFVQDFNFPLFFAPQLVFAATAELRPNLIQGENNFQLSFCFLFSSDLPDLTKGHRILHYEVDYY